MGQRTTCKTILGSKMEYPGGTNTYLQFYPDYYNGRNREWADASPSLSFALNVRNDVAEQFVQGGKYTLTIEQDDEPEAAPEPEAASEEKEEASVGNAAS